MKGYELRNKKGFLIIICLISVVIRPVRPFSGHVLWKCYKRISFSWSSDSVFRLTNDVEYQYVKKYVGDFFFCHWLPHHDITFSFFTFTMPRNSARIPSVNKDPIHGLHFHILSFVSIVFVNSCNSALEGCHMIWIKSIYLSKQGGWVGGWVGEKET